MSPNLTLNITNVAEQTGLFISQIEQFNFTEAQVLFKINIDTVDTYDNWLALLASMQESSDDSSLDLFFKKYASHIYLKIDHPHENYWDQGEWP